MNVNCTFDPSPNPCRHRIAGIILAAGKASRMGRLKQLLPYRGKPLLAHVLDHAAASDMSPLILVLGCGRKEIQKALPDPPAQVILNRAWESGMATSIAAGIERLSRQAPGAAGTFFLLGDQPLVDTALLNTLADQAARTPDRIIIPTFRQKRGNPVYFPRKFFQALCRLSENQYGNGDSGGSQLFKKYPGAIVEVPVETQAVRLDIDTPEEYDNLRTREET